MSESVGRVGIGSVLDRYGGRLTWGQAEGKTG